MSAGKTPPTRTEALRAWAAERLDISSDATPEQARRAFLAQLAEHDFVPYEGQLEAWRVFGDARAAADGEPAGFPIYYEHELVATVEEFAREFFDLAPRARRVRWAHLSAQCETSPLAVARLKALATGLDVVPPAETGDDLHDTLVRTACRLHVLDPLRQPAVERKFFERTEKDAAPWEMAARRLCEAHPDLEQLTPRFFNQLQALRKQSQQEVADRKRRDNQQTSEGHGALLSNPSKRTPSSASSGWVISVFLAIAASLARGAGGCNQHSTTPKRSSQYSAPTASQPTLRHTFTHEQLAKWFNATDEELENDKGQALFILFGLDQVRNQYRAKLQELEQKYEGVGTLENDSFIQEHPEANREVRLERRLDILQKQLALLRLQLAYLYPPQSSASTVPDPTAPLRLAVSNLESSIDATEQDLALLRARPGFPNIPENSPQAESALEAAP